MNRADFQQLAALRLDEARSLLAAGQPSGAYYLAGYAVERALKACIARQTRAENFPPRPETVRNMYTHDLSRLVRIAELQSELVSARAANPAFQRYWETVSTWSEQARYETFTQAQAADLLTAISDPTNGVMQ